MTRPPLTWSPSHNEKGGARIFFWKPHTGTAGFEPGTHAWLASQSGALPFAPCPLLMSWCYFFNLFFFWLPSILGAMTYPPPLLSDGGWLLYGGGGIFSFLVSFPLGNSGRLVGCDTSDSKLTHSVSVGLMLVQCHRSWPNINPSLFERHMFTGQWCHCLALKRTEDIFCWSASCLLSICIFIGLIIVASAEASRVICGSHDPLISREDHVSVIVPSGGCIQFKIISCSVDELLHCMHLRLQVTF